MPSRIEDYALLGDRHTAALVSKQGSVDWLCFPSFDSPACFAALLGEPEHGRWLIAPREKVIATKRRYREGTLILETDLETENGKVTLIECMPERSEQLDLVRMVVGKEGQVRMNMELILRFDYGSIVPWVTREDHTLRAVAGPDTVLLISPVQLEGKEFTTVADFTVRKGDRIPFVLLWHPSHESPAETRDPEQIIQETEDQWREWIGQCTCQGPYREAVQRSLITLKALTYCPTGGMVAAPTTSLPEQPGGTRNWDYRYCWLRDATITLYALILNGYLEEARDWREWLLRAIAGKPSQLNILYSITGKRRLEETVLDWLPGYEGASPVRIGNKASEQFQLDVHGEIMDALHLARRAGLPSHETIWCLQRALLRHLEEVWTEPDDGIWEVRGPRRHFVHSKVMAWVAVDRMIKSAEHFDLEGPVKRWKSLRKKIHKEICEKGFNKDRNSFVQYYGSKEVDAALLMIPLVGFLDVNDPRMKGTVEAIEKDLASDGLVLRYRTRRTVDGLPPGEGAFLPCSFWLADNYLLQGRKKEGKELFERLLALRNDVGLLSEEYSLRDERMLGNFPQAFTHVALINTAANVTNENKPGEDRAEP